MASAACTAGMFAAVLSLTPPGAVAAQSLLDRPPDLGGTWVGEPGVLHFHFMHRFDATGPPTRKVLNTPTFLLGASLPHRLLVGARYATNSAVRTGFPNEWEFFGRWSPLAGAAGAPPPLALHVGWNQAAESLDGEVQGAVQIDRLRLLAAVRGFTSPYGGDDPRGAVAAGAVYRLHEWVALAGDASVLLDREGGEGDEGGEEVAWGAGLQLRVPYTPHTLSLHASNVTTTTLEGASRGLAGTRWGFEFTVPLTLRRYFGGASGGSGGGDVATGGATPGAAAADTVAAEIGMTNLLAFVPDTVRIRVGESVRWVNDSQIFHTVTADPEQAVRPESVRLPEGAVPFDSGDMLPGDEFVVRFDVPGEYRYFCVPHELAGMVGTVVVEP